MDRPDDFSFEMVAVVTCAAAIVVAGIAAVSRRPGVKEGVVTPGPTAAVRATVLPTLDAGPMPTLSPSELAAWKHSLLTRLQGTRKLGT